MIEIARILCPVDFCEASERALEYATATARWYGSRLDVLYVQQEVPVVGMIPSLVASPATQIATRSVENARLHTMAAGMVQRVVDAGVPVDLAVRDARDVGRAILDQALDRDIDLIVMGSHGRTGLQRLFLGSVAEKIIRQASCPVLIVPPLSDNAAPVGDVGFDSILCAVDFSMGSRAALEYAISLAEEADAHLTILNVIEVPPELQAHSGAAPFNVDAMHAEAEARALEQLRQLIPASVREYCHLHTAVAEGSAYRVIVRSAHERRCDLIVMGVQGRGAVDRFVFGSNTDRVIRAASCPVLTVPAG